MKKVFSALLLPAALCFLLIIYGPCEQYFANVYDFSFDVYDLLVMLLAAFAIAIVIAFAVLMVADRISGKLLAVILAFSLGALLAFYVQGTFFSKNLPVIDGHIIDWGDYSYMRVQSVLIWLFSMLFSFMLLFFLKSDRFRRLASVAGGIAIVFLIFSAFMSGLMGDGFMSKNDVVVTNEKIGELSNDTNFIILLVDAVDADAFDELLVAKPEIQKDFDGFTFFKNSVTCYNFTAYSVPEILSGDFYLCQKNYYQYLNDVYNGQGFLNGLKEAGYRMRIYYQDVPKVYDWLENYENIMANDKLAGFIYPANFVKTMIKLSGIKYFPYDLKTRCDVTPISLMGDSEKKSDWGTRYNSDLTSFDNLIEKTEFITAGGKEFSFIYLDGAHTPFETMPDLSFSQLATYSGEVEASAAVVSNYLKKMKAAGVYDNSVIVVLADHGYQWSEGKGRQNPVLLVKGIKETGELITDDIPVSYANLRNAFENLLTGQKARDAFKMNSSDERYYYTSSAAVGASSFAEYIQKGYADDLTTLVETGNVYSFEHPRQ